MSNSILKLFTDDEITRIHHATLDLMENIGVKFSFEEAKHIFQDHGLRVSASDVVYFPPHIVEAAIRSAPRRFTRYPLCPDAEPIKVGDGKFYVSPGSTPLWVLDLHTGERRKARLRDVEDFAKLGDGLANLALGNGVVQPLDIPETVVHALWQQAVMKNTAKPAPAYNALEKDVAEEVVELVSIVCGGEEELARKKTYAFTACPNSALFWGRAVVSFTEGAKRGMPLEIMPMPFCGSTHPVSLAGTLVQMNAEILSIVVLSQFIRRGTPVIYAPYGGIMDMKSATHSLGCPEAALLAAAAAQIARFYELPCDAIAGTSDSKVPDAQAAYEKMMCMLLPAMAGVDTVTLAAGLIDFAALASFEQLVIDDEITANIKRILEGVDLTEDKLAIDVIAEVGHGGNYLAHEHTLKYFREEHFIPDLTDRRLRGSWEEEGAKDILERAREKAKHILAEHKPTHMDEDTAKELDKAVLGICKRRGVQYQKLPDRNKKGS